MQIVIEIPEEDYTNIKNAINSLIENGVELTSMSKVCLAIKDGTPLPEGHGRLGDLDALRDEISSWGMNDYEPSDFTDEIDRADTIIEAALALEQEPCGDWHDVPSDEMTLGQARQAVKDLRKKLAEYLWQKPCEDEYIKVPKKALKYRTAGMVAYNAEWLKDHFDIERAVICGAQQPCEDAISRQAVLELVADYDLSMGQVVKQIHALPPVTPQSKIGKWIIIDDCEHFIAKCSECGRIEDSRMINKYPYCHCGAKMQEVEE